MEPTSHRAASRVLGLAVVLLAAAPAFGWLGAGDAGIRGPFALAAQDDVEELGRVYGVRPPAAYFETRARDPRAFQFSRAWIARNPRVRVVEAPGGGPPTIELRERGGAEGQGGGLTRRSPASVAGVLGRREGPVEGTFRFPLLLGYYADMESPPPFTAADVQAEFFDGPNSRSGTITEFYDEISGGRVDLRGVTFDWVQAPYTAAEVAGGVSGLGPPAQVGAFILSLLAAHDDGTIDWGQFDNDGPDGVPNSGDDDGFVDLLTVFHPTSGAECGLTDRNNRVWSHKWSLSSWEEGGYTSGAASANGGFIQVDDYTIQPVYDCDGGAINEIGVFAHELGHGFGLPDLYCTRSQCGQEGIGRWGLMGSGSWGCGIFDPARPCHMSAWSKYVLGWVEAETLQPDQDLPSVVLEPVETSGRLLRVDAQDGSNEYYLLENRQRIGFDAQVPAEGLLVWHIDPDYIDAHWLSNTVNNDETHLGVWLRQADGKGDLEARGASQGNRGDAGDPFPGSTAQTAFHAGTNPQAFTHGGRASGLTLLDIARGGQDVSFRALTRFQALTLRTEGESAGGLLTLDDEPMVGAQHTFDSAPFQSHVIEAALATPPGHDPLRTFEGWTDDELAPRLRLVATQLEDSEYVAQYGALSLAALAAPFMTAEAGAGPTTEQRLFLDDVGNRNGLYDLGDLRAFLRAYPTALTSGGRLPPGLAGPTGANAGPGGAP